MDATGSILRAPLNRAKHSAAPLDNQRGRWALGSGQASLCVRILQVSTSVTQSQGRQFGRFAVLHRSARYVTNRNDIDAVVKPYWPRNALAPGSALAHSGSCYQRSKIGGAADRRVLGSGVRHMPRPLWRKEDQSGASAVRAPAPAGNGTSRHSASVRTVAVRRLNLRSSLNVAGLGSLRVAPSPASERYPADAVSASFKSAERAEP